MTEASEVEERKQVHRQVLQLGPYEEAAGSSGSSNVSIREPAVRMVMVY